MKTIGIFYGSTTGTTEAVARRLARMLDVADSDIHNVADTLPSTLGQYDLIVLGTSTWGNGSLQDDWQNFIAGAEALDLSGRQVAIFGCGDETMEDTFCDAVGIIYDRMKGTGATLVGATDADGYHYRHSLADLKADAAADTPAAADGELPATHPAEAGLLLDEVNHPELTDLRLRAWAGQLLG